MAGPQTYRPKFGYDIRIKPDMPPHSGDGHVCAITGCGADAELHVPKNRYNLQDRHWLCRDHVRAHNERWDFFAGMSQQEIYSFRVEAITGHRPTWPLGKRAAERRENAGREARWAYYYEDGFAIFADAAEPARPRRATRLTKGQIDALATLNLEDDASLHDIKARYKELVKRYHPDANGGDRGAEERLKQVIRAYGHLRATGLA